MKSFRRYQMSYFLFEISFYLKYCDWFKTLSLFALFDLFKSVVAFDDRKVLFSYVLSRTENLPSSPLVIIKKETRNRPAPKAKVLPVWENTRDVLIETMIVRWFYFQQAAVGVHTNNSNQTERVCNVAHRIRLVP